MRIIKLLSLPVLLFCFCMGSGYAQSNAFPSYITVIDSFFARYQNSGSLYYLQFHKKKEGWYVAEASYEDTKSFGQVELFWSKERNAFLKLSFETGNGDEETGIDRAEQYISNGSFDYDEYLFNRLPYYGYIGWDWDIITQKQVPSNMTDTLWEAYARANSNYAQGFLFDQSGSLFENNDPDRVELDNDEKIPATRIKKYLSYQREAIRCYDSLVAKNPSYVTRVGNSSIKQANELIYTWFTLNLAGYPSLAGEFMERCKLPDSLVVLAKNYLDNAPGNAIIICGGDNDTYPMWYVQEKEKYRTDVIVLNISLLGLVRHIAYLDAKYQGKLFGAQKEIYLDNSFVYSIADTENADTSAIEAGAFLRHLNEYKPGVIIEHGDKTLDFNQLKKYQHKKIYFKCNPPLAKQGDSRSQEIEIGNYLLLNDFMLLDIINSQCSQREIFLSFSYELLNSLLVEKGPLLKVDVTGNLP